MLHLSSPLKLTKQSKEILNLLAEIKSAPLEVRIRVLKDVDNNIFFNKLKKGRETNIARFFLGDKKIHTRDKKEANKILAKYK